MRNQTGPVNQTGGLCMYSEPVPPSDPALQRTIVDLLDRADEDLTRAQLRDRLGECGWDVSIETVRIACTELVAKGRLVLDGGVYRVKR
jgi:hypothetical protein